jgi:dolichyl-phosphate beta-glucosyltransferase
MESSRDSHDATGAETIDWVVPCFNEAERLSDLAFRRLLDETAPSRLIFVDDGSRDGTLARQRAIARQWPEHAEVLALPSNQGKAEAVRQGMLHALAGRSDILAFIDADFATPVSELARLASLCRVGHYDILLGSRVQLLGHAIARKHTRHYVGRVFATCASLCLRLPVYDTQCGAKLFRRSQALVAALATPFTSRWAFDVEFLARMVRPDAGVAPVASARIREEPLLAWTDVPGSKLHPAAAVRSGLELLRIGWRLRRPH